MARDIACRLCASGRLKALTPIHVGGLGDDPLVDLPLARDGRGCFYIPGTSLAGALRAWTEAAWGKDRTQRLWGYQEQKADEGSASLVRVNDGLVHSTEDQLMCLAGIEELRDGVGIDRVTGAAALGIKYERAVLPRDSMIDFALVVELPPGADAGDRAAIGCLLRALADGEIRLGGGKTRGSGRVRLERLSILEQDLHTRRGILAALRGQGSAVALDDLCSGLEPPFGDRPRFVFEIQWAPKGPLMVKSGAAGTTIDALPLLGLTAKGLAPVLPGSSLKGTLRSQAERIVRTVTNRRAPRHGDPRQLFLRQVEVPLVDQVFGIATRHDEAGPAPAEGPLPGQGALAVDDCYAAANTSPAAWQRVVRASSADELTQALAESGPGWVERATHVAVDRWTGGAAEGLLFTVLEPREIAWDNIRVEVDLGRVAEVDWKPAVALLLLTLMDLACGRVPLGFGGQRGLGAIEVRSIGVTCRNADKAGFQWLNEVELRGCSLAGLDPRELSGIEQAWRDWVKRHRKGGAE